MLKKLIAIGALSLSQAVFAATPDALTLAGHWMCSGYDMHEGYYSKAPLILTLDPKDSDMVNGYGAYHFKLVESDGTTYVGEVAANGNTAAVYFENTSAKMLTDRGVGIAMITHDRDQHNNVTTVLHKFYYEPTYEGGGNGSETCVKQ